MIRLLLIRIGTSLLVAFVVSAIVFALAPLAAVTDAASIAAGSSASGNIATEEQLQAARVRLGLDQPVPVQYVRWLGKALHGDLGSSLFRQESVTQAVLFALPVTLSITLFAMLVIVLVALPAGMYAAIRPGGRVDRAVLFVSALGVAMPNFVVGLFLVRIFAIQLGILPSIGFKSFTSDPVEWLLHILLPAVALAVPGSAALARYVRASVADVMARDYIRTAVGKGLPERVVTWKHALKNAMIPIVTVLGLELRTLLGGSVAVEAVFALPGLGTLTVRSVLEGDYPLLEGIVLTAVVIVIAINVLVDMSYAYLNPKVRFA